MQIQLNPDNVQVDDTLAHRIDEEVHKALKHHQDRITRVEVHLKDENGPKAGVDKQCVMEARLAGDDPVTINEQSDDLTKLIHQAAEKLQRAVSKRIERAKDLR
jgi:ribosomal subunit interface protein